MLTSNAISAPIAMIFRINDDLLSRALDGLSPGQLWHRPTDKNNPILWLAGHIAQTRADMLALMGHPLDTGWKDLFARGSSVGKPEKYPSIAEIQRILRDVNQKLYGTVESLDEDRLGRPFPGLSVPNVKNAAEQLAGFALHDSYHVGQVAYIRKGLGYSAIAG